MEREVGQLLGELNAEQSKLEDVCQQNAKLEAELQQLRRNLNLTAFDDPHPVMVCLLLVTVKIQNP